MNLWLGRSARQIIRAQFNEEQLVVARHVKYWVERQLAYLEKELQMAAGDIKDTPHDTMKLSQILRPCFQRVTEMGVYRIELGHRGNGKTYFFYPNHSEAIDTRFPPDVASGGDQGVSDPPLVISRPSAQGAEIVFELRLDFQHTDLAYLAFRINVTWFLSPALKNIRSGITGYAWIIDDQGRFLYHPQYEFIGQSAFEARQGRDPDISYHQINTIQRDSMLKGMEGTGAYQSTWHRGITGKMEKLIAYSPITLSTVPRQIWSVAVVAPVFEIEEAVGKVHRWLAVLQSLIILVIVTAGAVLFWLQLRWSNQLEEMVDDRTQALKRSEENYRSLVESAEDFIYSVDASGQLVSVNNFTAAFFGSRPSELVGRGVQQLFTPAIADRHQRIVHTVIEKNKSQRGDFEFEVGGTTIWLSANFMPLKDNQGQMSAVLCIARDITESKKLERSLISSEKLASLGTLAAGVAHEINNPLGVMLGFCDLLVRQKTPGSQEYEDLRIIERQGLQCKQIVENLLSFARVGAETAAHTDINLCLQEIIAIVRHNLEIKAIDLQLALAPDLPLVAGDHRQYQQVFLNLITNAVAAMPEGGLLTIRSWEIQRGKKVIAQVQDSGSGIPPDVMDHIFEPFFTTKPEGEGTGLGLFVSYGIVQKFGGNLFCDSRISDGRGKGKGTIFTVELPAIRES